MDEYADQIILDGDLPTHLDSLVESQFSLKSQAARIDSFNRVSSPTIIMLDHVILKHNRKNDPGRRTTHRGVSINGSNY